jgi:hypothetical protein
MAEHDDVGVYRFGTASHRRLGAWRFKCTTIPILRRDYVLTTAERTAEFFRRYCHTDLRDSAPPAS